MHNRISLFLLALKKEQAIDEYYRQVGGGWLFFVANPGKCIFLAFFHHFGRVVSF